MSTTNNLRTVAERIARTVWPREYPIKQTATGGSVNTWVCGNDAYPVTSTSAYRGVYIWVIYDAGGASAAPENEIRAVTGTGFVVGTGTFTIQPSFTVSPAASDQALFLYGLHKDDLIEAVNDCLRTTPLPRYSILSLCNDANMENAGADVATDWPDVTGTPTQTKETTEVFTGKQSLKLVTTVLDESVRSLSIPVTEGENLYLWVPVKCTAGSLAVQLYDVTNAAEIDSVTVDEEAWTIVAFQGTTPSDCQNVQVRFIAKTAATTAYVDCVGLLSDQRTVYTPNLMGDAVDLEGVYAWSPGYSSEAANSYVALSREMRPWTSAEILRDYAGVNSHRINVKPYSEGLWLKYWATDAEFSALTDVTVMPLEMLVAGAAANCLQKLAEGTRDAATKTDYLNRAVAHANQFKAWKRTFQVARPRGGRSPQRRVSVA